MEELGFEVVGGGRRGDDFVEQDAGGGLEVDGGEEEGGFGGGVEDSVFLEHVGLDNIENEREIVRDQSNNNKQIITYNIAII